MGMEPSSPSPAVLNQGNAMESYPDRSDDARYCALCAEVTNHRTQDHEMAEWERDHPDGVDDRFDVRADTDKDGPDL